MSFTVTPTKAKLQKKPKFILEKGKSGRVILTEEQLKEFKRLFPKNSNVKMMEMFGIGFSTVQRLKRELGLKKNMKVIKHKQAMDIKRKCEKNGYYDSLRGKRNEAMIEGYKRFSRETNFSSIRTMREKNPKKYARWVEENSRNRKELIRKERRRAEWGRQQTKLHLPQFKFTKQEMGQRYNAKKRGYILGDWHEYSGERYIIYYDENTRRSRQFEKNIEKAGGFRIKEFVHNFS